VISRIVVYRAWKSCSAKKLLLGYVEDQTNPKIDVEILSVTICANTYAFYIMQQ